MTRYFPLTLLAVATPASAHTGHHHGFSFADVVHFLTQPTHAGLGLAALAAIGLVAIRRRKA